MESVDIVHCGLFNVMLRVSSATPTFLWKWMRPSATGAQNPTQLKLINIKFALIYLTISSTIGVYPLSRNSRQPTLQETYVMPILNKPVVFQPHESFSVNVFLVYAGYVPKVWKLIKNKYISVISVITDINLALHILPYFPPKSWNKFISNFKKQQQQQQHLLALMKKRSP